MNRCDVEPATHHYEEEEEADHKYKQKLPSRCKLQALLPGALMR
jgi:hypothetical protein